VRYLNMALSVALVASASAAACSGDSTSIGAGSQAGSAGDAGATTQGGTGASGGVGGGTTGNGGNASSAAGNGGTAGGAAGAGPGGTGPGGTGGAAGEAATAGEGGAAGGEQQTVGSLTVTVSGVPDGNTTSVTVSGPDSFSQSVSTTTTLQNLEPGTYTVATPSAIRVSGTQVDSVFDAAITGSGVVEAGATASVAVTYAQRPGTGMMWVTNWVTRNAFGFSAAQLATTGDQTDGPTTALFLSDSGTGSSGATSLAFSATGDAWVGYCHSTTLPQAVAKLAPTKLATSGAVSADVVIKLPSTNATYDCASALAFDASGNLWVGTYKGNILRFDASALAVSGTPAPTITLTNTTYFNGILDLAFDNAGNLFVAPYLKPVVSRLSAAQLTASDSAVVPAVQLTMPAGAGPGGLALGAGGDLWVSDYNHNNVIEIAAANLGTTQTPAPAVTLTGIPGPEQLAFDGAGNLWVAAYNNSKVYAFAAGDLATGGAATPLTTLSGGGALSSTFAIRFDPAAP
jgi:hypothetical protein